MDNKYLLGFLICLVGLVCLAVASIGLTIACFVEQREQQEQQREQQEQQREQQEQQREQQEQQQNTQKLRADEANAHALRTRITMELDESARNRSTTRMPPVTKSFFIELMVAVSRDMTDNGNSVVKSLKEVLKKNPELVANLLDNLTFGNGGDYEHKYEEIKAELNKLNEGSPEGVLQYILETVAGRYDLVVIHPSLNSEVQALNGRGIRFADDTGEGQILPNLKRKYSLRNTQLGVNVFVDKSS
jgi:hypothetical protein